MTVQCEITLYHDNGDLRPDNAIVRSVECQCKLVCVAGVIVEADELLRAVEACLKAGE
jgi:hypothetical protein